MPILEPITIAPNWTSAVGALESILAYLGAQLPRHAVMGLAGHAWHFCLGTHDDVVALPSGPADIDRTWLTAAYARTGFEWEDLSVALPAGGDHEAVKRHAALWASSHLEAGRPLIGWDFHLHEHAVVYGYDEHSESFLISDILSRDLGPRVALADWPSALGRIEFLAPKGPLEADPLAVIDEALQAAIETFAGCDGPADGQARGLAGLQAWAAAFDTDQEVDRAGNAYTLAVLAAARTDGAAFLADLAESIPGAASPLTAAAAALNEETKTLAPLLTLFPFPAGGHGNITNHGLRGAAAMALRRAASHEETAANHITEAVRCLAR